MLPRTPQNLTLNPIFTTPNLNGHPALTHSKETTILWNHLETVAKLISNFM